jgi:uncharacterized membrane protein YagU involved in acid resistance
MNNTVMTPSVTSIATAGLIGGTVSGLTMFAFTLVGHHTMGLQFFQQIAHIAFPYVEFAQTTATLTGLLIHFAVCIGWALGYAYMARTTTALRQSPIISGICFGLLVEMAMDGLLVMINQFSSPSPAQFLRDIIAHSLAFGVPLAYTVARTLPSGSRNTISVQQPN